MADDEAPELVLIDPAQDVVDLSDPELASEPEPVQAPVPLGYSGPTGRDPIDIIPPELAKEIRLDPVRDGFVWRYPGDLMDLGMISAEATWQSPDPKGVLRAWAAVCRSERETLIQQQQRMQRGYIPLDPPASDGPFYEAWK